MRPSGNLPGSDPAIRILPEATICTVAPAGISMPMSDHGYSAGTLTEAVVLVPKVGGVLSILIGPNDVDAELPATSKAVPLVVKDPLLV